jgi:hypothetical protein
MNIDLKVMRPGKLAGLLNSTRLGEVTSETASAATSCGRASAWGIPRRSTS